MNKTVGADDRLAVHRSIVDDDDVAVGAGGSAGDANFLRFEPAVIDEQKAAIGAQAVGVESLVARAHVP